MSGELIMEQKRFFTVDNDTDSYLILKVGQGPAVALNEHAAFNKYKHIKDNKSKAIFALLHSPDSKITNYKIKNGSFKFNIKKPELIFRMPNSPVHTFFIIDFDKPGKLESILENGTVLLTLDLNTCINELINLDVSLRPDGTINFSGLPHFIYGKINQK
jgi:hypothetical protein